MRLLEREAELDAVEARLATASSGSGSTLLVEGPAGIGKTALLMAAVDRAVAAEFDVLVARGGELERGLSFGIVRQLFEHRVADAPDAERADLLSGAAELAGPAIGAAPEGDDDGDPLAAIQHGLYWLTANLAQTRPVLIAVDDAQWSDAPSIRWLVYLARRLGELPIAALLTRRTGEPNTDDAVFAALASEPATAVIRPATLSEEATAALVRDRLGVESTDAFVSACARASGGNPFLLGELIAAIDRDEMPAGDEAVADVERLAPEAISRSILLRLARMPAASDPLARAVAVLGARAELGVAAELAELDPAAAAAAADALVAGAILVAGAPLRFAHPLIGGAVSAQIPDAERALAHARAAHLLADRAADDEEVAGHLLRAQAGEGEWAVEQLRRAARSAVGRGAPQAAVTYLRRAFAEPAPDLRTQLIPELAAAAMRAYDISAFEGITDDPAAELEQAPEALRESQLQLGAWLYMSGRMEESRAFADRGIAAERAAGNIQRALEYEIGLLAVFDFTPEEALARLDDYRREVEPGTTPERLWLAMLAWWQHFGSASASLVGRLALRALDGGALIRDLPELPAPGQAILVMLRADELDAAEPYIELMEEGARRRGSIGWHAMASGVRSQLELRRGDVMSAIELARASVAVNREQGVAAVILPILTGWLVDGLTEAGELEQANAELEASGIAGELGDHFWLVPPRFARARLRAAQGRRNEAVADLRVLLDRPLPAEFAVDSSLAVLQAAEGELEEAANLADAGVERAQKWGAPSAVGIALRAKALVTGGDEGIAILREAVATLESSPNRLEHARALTDLGAALRRSNQRREARERLAKAVEMAHRGGARAVEQRAREELAATGAKPRRVMLSGVESLTASELRVARMAAEGKENREIAQALFVTVKTVETHLTHVYRKLDIASRRELPEALGSGA